MATETQTATQLKEEAAKRERDLRLDLINRLINRGDMPLTSVVEEAARLYRFIEDGSVK